MRRGIFGLMATRHTAACGNCAAKVAPPPPVVASPPHQRGHFDDGEAIGLSFEPLQAMPFATRGDYRLATMPMLPASARRQTAQALYVEPFNAEQTAGSDLDDGSLLAEPVVDESVVASPPPAARRATVGGAPQARTGESRLMNEDEFERDLRKILSGRGKQASAAQDASRAEVVSERAASSTRAPRQAPELAPTPAAPELAGPTKNEHAIFERIAQSMKMANAYDLGSIDLDGRFDAFDREADTAESKSRTVSKRVNGAAHTPAGAAVLQPKDSAALPSKEGDDSDDSDDTGDRDAPTSEQPPSLQPAGIP